MYNQFDFRNKSFDKYCINTASLKSLMFQMLQVYNTNISSNINPKDRY